MFAKRILTAILLSASVVATVANHNAKYKVPGWQKVRHFQLCLNGTFDDPSTFTNSTYADTLHVVNCDQRDIMIGDFSILCGGLTSQTCSGHLIVGDHPNDSAMYMTFISDETDLAFQLNHVAVLAATGHFPKIKRFATDDDGAMISYDEMEGVATLTVNYKGKAYGPTNILEPRPSP